MRNWQGESGVTYYYGQDAPGHVLGLANASNQMVNRYRYDPWGGSEMKSEGEPATLALIWALWLVES